jgi:thiol:disulfide interchange protein DsbD
VKFIGETLEPESIKEYDPNFEGELNFFKDEVTFVQKVEVEQPTELSGTVTYMICNDVMCLPPVDEFFKIEVK